jgi:hypothetical protein
VPGWRIPSRRISISERAFWIKPLSLRRFCNSIDCSMRVSKRGFTMCVPISSSLRVVIGMPSAKLGRNVSPTKAVALVFSLTLREYLYELAEFYRDYTLAHWQWADQEKQVSAPALKALQELLDAACEVEHIARNEARVALGDSPVPEVERRIPMHISAAPLSRYMSESTTSSPISPISPGSVSGRTFASNHMENSYRMGPSISTRSLNSTLWSPETSPQVSPARTGHLRRAGRSVSFTALPFSKFNLHSKSFSSASDPRGRASSETPASFDTTLSTVQKR